MNEGMEFDAAVKLAQQQGYAEADPTLDVGGHDAAHKVGILASLAHGFWVKPKQVYTEGIEQVAPLDLEFADSLGYAIKLLGIVKTSKPGPVQVSMYPALIPDDHVLANVSDVYNGILVRGDVVGDTLHYGQGAGRDATASAVLSDIGDAVLDLMSSCVSHLPDEPKPLGVTGHGMNLQELKANQQLDDYFIQNLNKSPSLSFDDAEFDLCLIAVSVQYLTDPVSVFSESARILKPGGRALFYAWAKEQKDGAENRSGHQFDASDVLVPFHLREHGPHYDRETARACPAHAVRDERKNATVLKRYCHVFAEGELRGLVSKEARVDECYYDEGNWAVACTKL